jgi:hypothetical protein
MYPGRGAKSYRGRTVGAAKTISEAVVSDGSSALEILNWRVDEQGVLDSTFRLMPFIPDEWASPDGIPAPFAAGVQGIAFMRKFGETPELLFFTPPFSSGQLSYGSVWRFTPWTRDAAIAWSGLTEQLFYIFPDNTTRSVIMQGKVRYPPQFEVVGNRVYFTFCDGGGAWVWDGEQVRDFGFTGIPSAPDIDGPYREAHDSPNAGGFSVRGRIGTTDHSFTNAGNETVGGIDDGTWRYAVVWENVDGAYSATSPLSGAATIRLQIADPTTEAGNMENLRRRFLLRAIPAGPNGTAARLILRTRNLLRLPVNDQGDARFLFRIPNNHSQEWIDDAPDGELGPLHEDRMATPVGFYFLKFFSGSMFILRNDGYPARVWWSEQGNLNGPTPESIIMGHYRDVFPATGPITASIVTRMSNVQEPPTLLIFKEGAVHFVAGEFPDWTFGTVHERAGCAGPGCVQIAGDGSTIWYGARTFWRMDAEGRVEDIGAPIRRRLRKINTARAEFGVSWVDKRSGEVVFALPYEDSTGNNFQFVWDWRLNGWRTRQDLQDIEAAFPLPGTDYVLVSGTYDNKTNLWVYGQGYPNYEVTYPTAIYRTGWCLFEKPGPGMHGLFNAHDLILTQMERSGGTAAVRTYQDWSLDDVINTETAACAHPENSDIPLYGTATWDAWDYRDTRFFNQRVVIDVPSASAFSSELEITGPMALISADMYGPQVAMAGGRTPQLPE